LIAYISFDEPKKAVQAFNEFKNAKAKNYFEKDPIISIRLSDENESYTNLITVGLVKKDTNQTDAQFEEELYNVFKDNFEGVLHVSVKIVKKKDSKPEDQEKPEKQTYLAFINLETDDLGKELLATYLTEKKKKALQKYYVSEPFVNLFCSTNFIKDYKKVRQNYKRIEKDIKTNADNLKKEEL
jgi:hypothetical protein